MEYNSFMRRIREEFKKLGIEFENSCLIYSDSNKGRIVAIPYKHIVSVELKDDKVMIQVGGIEKIIISLPSDTLASLLFEELLLQIERTYL